MLQMRFRQSDVARSAQVKGARALRDSAFNVRTRLVALFEFLSGLALTGSLQRLVLGLWFEVNCADLAFSFSAPVATHTADTILMIKLNLINDFSAS
jgi:hypothetical protein